LFSDVTRHRRLRGRGHFLRGAVRDAAKARGYDPDAPSALYVAGVLATYARPEWIAHGVLQGPLTLALADALQTAGAERFLRLRGSATTSCT